jgi:transcriptional regulator with XRE-family HTH domain
MIRSAGVSFEADAIARLPDERHIDAVACRGARAMLGVSQTELCKLASVGRNSLVDFENMSKVPVVEALDRLREALESLGAHFYERDGIVAVGVDPDAAAERSPRARSFGSHG